MRTVQALVRADHLRTLSLFELRMLPSHARESLNVPPVATIERLAGAAFVVSTDAISRYAEPGSTARLAEWAESAADSVSRGQPLPPSPVPDRFLAGNCDRTRRTLKPARHRTTRVGGSACCFGSALNARRLDWLLLLSVFSAHLAVGASAAEPRATLGDSGIGHPPRRRPG